MKRLTTRLLGRIKCCIGRHDWRTSLLIPLNITGPVFVCTRCRKQVCYDRGGLA